MKMVEVGEIAKALTGFPFDSTLFNESVGFPLIRIRNLKQGRTDTFYNGEFDKLFLVKKGDLLIGMDGEFNLVEWDSEDALLNQRVMKLIANEKVVSKHYLKYALPKKLKEIEDATPFVTVKHLSHKKVLESKILLPDLKTQQKIASILEQADTARQKRKQANQLTEQFLQSAFLEMFGDPVSNDKGWEKQNIRTVCDKFSDGPFGSNLKTEHYSVSGVRVIRLNNIGVGEFIDSDKSFIPIEHYETLKKHSCLPGDVLIGTMGDPNLRACILPKEINLAINKADCILCRPNRSIAVAEYFCYLLNNETFVNSVSNLVLGQTRGRISMGRLATVDISIPPLHLQKKFATLVAQVEQLRVKQIESEKVLENLFNSLMQKYFG